jgi:hypothetical protein
LVTSKNSKKMAKLCFTIQQLSAIDRVSLFLIRVKHTFILLMNYGRRKGKGSDNCPLKIQKDKYLVALLGYAWISTKRISHRARDNSQISLNQRTVRLFFYLPTG